MHPFYERASARIVKDHKMKIEDRGGIHDITREEYDALEDACIRLEASRIRRVNRHKAKLQELVPELGNKRLNRMLFITVRPVNIEFPAFKFLVEKFINNKNKFDAVEYAYEQKGENSSNIGDGFHVHIIARMSVTTRKMEVLSHCKTVFKPHCPQPDIKVIYNDEDLSNKRNYIRDSKSADDNKKWAHEYDAKWRLTLGLQDIYTRGEIESQ